MALFLTASALVIGNAYRGAQIDAPAQIAQAQAEEVIHLEVEPEPEQPVSSEAMEEDNTLIDAARRLEFQSESWSLDQADDQEEPVARIIPESINFYLAETLDYRLDEVDMLDMPKEVKLALWPDSLLVESDREYFLINPPTDIIQAYYLSAVTEDIGNLYFDAMKGAKGLFLVSESELISDTPLGRLVMFSMADQGKEIIVLHGSVDPELRPEIANLKLQLDSVNYILNEDFPDVSLTQQLQRIREKAQHGEELNVVMLAKNSSVEELKASFAELQPAMAGTSSAIDESDP